VAGGGPDLKSLVLGSVDIVELIGRTVALKKRGRNYLGLCPFHNEKSPSFNVNAERQFFKCFGCGAAGNAIDFVMKRDRLEFVEAMRAMAEQHGIEIPQYGGNGKEKTDERKRLFDANAAAAMFFEQQLLHPQTGQAARDYLAQRGITDETRKAFRIGLAPPAWDALLNSPVGTKFGAPFLAAGGLVKARENGSGFYDTFRNRLIFPIRDEQGRTIAFGGRVMPGDDSPAKYLNSPETIVYSKSKSIYGIDLARQRIIETQTAVVVEGYVDVVVPHQYGATNVVAALGTGLTEQHVSTLKRFARKIVLLFDADRAGERAADRAVELFLTQEVEIAIASMPDGMDPDEYLLKFGLDAFERQVIGQAQDALAFKWRQLSRHYHETGDLTAQQKAVEQYLELLAAARGTGPVDGLRWGMALAQVSRLTNIPVDELNRRFRNRPIHRPAIQPQRPVQQVAATASNTTPRPTPYNRRPLTATDRAERWILGCLLAEPHRWGKVQQDVSPADFTDELRRRLGEIYWQHQRDEGEPAFNEFLAVLQDTALTELAVELVDEVQGLTDLEETLGESVEHLRGSRRRVEDLKLMAALRRNNDGTPLAEQSEVDLLKQLQEKARQPDLRRV